MTWIIVENLVVRTRLGQLTYTNYMTNLLRRGCTICADDHLLWYDTDTINFDFFCTDCKEKRDVGPA